MPPDSPDIQNPSRSDARAERVRRHSPADLVWVLWPALLALLLAGPLWWQRGVVLSYDAVAVPQQVLLPWMWGDSSAPPRAVPQDAVVAVLDNVLPGGLVQRLMLLGALLMGGIGMCVLLRSRPVFERLSAATVFMWSAYVAERAVIGHWGLLLAYAAQPWVLSAARDVRGGQRSRSAALVLWVIVGSLTPTGGVLMVALTALVLLWPAAPGGSASAEGFKWRALTVVAAVAVQGSWLVAALINPGSSGTAADAVFGIRGEGPGGPLIAALTGGGIWSRDAVPGTRASILGAAAAVVLLAFALVGVKQARKVLGDLFPPLALLAVGGLVWALLTGFGPLATFVSAVEALPGGGLLRDGQKWLAPWCVLLAVCVGCGMGRLRSRVPASAAGPVAAGLLLLPMILLPDAAYGFGARLAAVSYPAHWEEVRSYLNAQPVAGPGRDDVVSLPWTAFRRYGWNSNTVNLDPAPRYLPRTVITNSSLIVRHGGELSTVASDDPRSTEVGEALGAPDPLAALRRAGVMWVLVQSDQPPAPGGGINDLVASLGPAVAGSEPLLLYRVPGEAPEHFPSDPGGSRRNWLLVGWILTVGTAGTALAAGLLSAIRGRFRAKVALRPTSSEQGC